MTSVNPLLALWRAGKPSLGGWLTTADPQIAEYLASGGFDEICVDQQHGLADSSNLAAMFRALEVHGVAPTTRVPANDFAAIGFALDIGAVADHRADGRQRRGGGRRGRGLPLPAARSPFGRAVARRARRAPRTGSTRSTRRPAS